LNYLLLVFEEEADEELILAVFSFEAVFEIWKKIAQILFLHQESGIAPRVLGRFELTIVVECFWKTASGFGTTHTTLRPDR